MKHEYRCAKCHTVRTLSTQPASTCCAWGGCSGTAWPVASTQCSGGDAVTLADLEASADAARKEHADSFARLNAVKMLLASLVCSEDAASDPKIPEVVRMDLRARIDWSIIADLCASLPSLHNEVDRLEDIYRLRCAALNEAPEEAA